MDDEKKYLLEIMKFACKQTSIDVNEVDVRDFAVQTFLPQKIYGNEIFHFILYFFWEEIFRSCGFWMCFKKSYEQFNDGCDTCEFF